MFRRRRRLIWNKVIDIQLVKQTLKTLILFGERALVTLSIITASQIDAKGRVKKNKNGKLSKFCGYAF